MKKTFFMVLAAAMLTMPIMADEDHYTRTWFNDGNYEVAENVKAAPTPKNLAEAVKALPALPTVDQICSAEAKKKAASATLVPYRMAVEQAMLLATAQNPGIQARINATRSKQAKKGQTAMQQYQSNVNAGLMPSQQEMMQMYMSGEINERMSDKQMMDVMAGKFAAKWGISKDEYIKIINMAQKSPKQTEAYLQSNHPDLYKRLYAANKGFDASEIADNPNAARLGEIMDELTALNEQFENAVMAYSGMGGGAKEVETRGMAFDKLYMELRDDWYKSAEAKQIEQIETDLWKRVEKWMSGISAHNGVLPYPGWWTDERKKENALIDQWNRRSAARWLKVAADGEKQFKAIFEKAAKLETENEQLGKSDPEDAVYLTNKLRFNNLLGMLLHLIQPLQDAYQFPCIEHVEETGEAILGKG